MIRILLNGEAKDIVEGSSVADLMRELKLQGQRIAVEINCEIVARSQFSEHRLQADDKVEIVHAIGGG